MKPRYLGKQNSFSNNSSLDKISRKESRKDFNEFESYGLDIWNAYEFSYLLGGKPKIVVLEISIPSNSKYTVESKSMKLFLNSFFNKSYIKQSDVINILKEEISKKCNSDVKIVVKNSFENFDINIFTNKSGLLIYKGFRSICPVTSQPDWGNIYIYSSTDNLNKKIFRISYSVLEITAGFMRIALKRYFYLLRKLFC